MFKEEPHFIYHQISDHFYWLTTESNDKHKDDNEGCLSNNSNHISG